MADEITLSIALDFAKGVRRASTRDMGLNGVEIDVAGTDFLGPFSFVVTTTAVQIPLGGITIPGYIAIKNIEGTNTSNYVLIRNGMSGSDVIQLLNNDIAVFRAAASTLFLDVDANSCEVAMLIIEA